MIATLLRWITGGGASSIAAEIRGAQADRLAAKNDTQRLAAEERMHAVATRLDAQTRGEMTWMAKAVRAAWAAPFIIYTGKIVLWDKVLGLGVTDPLGQYEQSLGMMIAAFYFIDASISRLRR